MSQPYLSVEQYKIRSVLRVGKIEAVERAAAGWLAQELLSWSKRIDVQLVKRYAVPFDASNPPEIIQQWLARIVDVRVMLKNGVDQQDEQYEDIREDAKEARAEIKEAADSETGMYELPLKGGSASSTAEAITKGGPYVYSEASPYAAFDVQEEAGRSEDSRGRGSSNV